MDTVKEQDKINFVFLEQEEKILWYRLAIAILPFFCLFLILFFIYVKVKHYPERKAKKFYVNKKRQKSVRKM